MIEWVALFAYLETAGQLQLIGESFRSVTACHEEAASRAKAGTDDRRYYLCVPMKEGLKVHVYTKRSLRAAVFGPFVGDAE